MKLVELPGIFFTVLNTSPCRHSAQPNSVFDDVEKLPIVKRWVLVLSHIR